MKDNEVAGTGNHLEFKFRGYDSRLGRFWSIDPLTSKYPWNSSYAFAENDVIRCKDLEGGERLDVVHNGSPTLGNPSSAQITISMDYKVVTQGRGALTNGVNGKDFTRRFNLGNTTFYMSQLPTPTTPGVFLSTKDAALAEKATSPTKKGESARQSLMKAGISYYIVNAVYDFKVSEGGTLEHTYEWMNEDRQGRGMIMTQGKDEEFLWSNTPEELWSIRNDAISYINNDPLVNGFGTNSTFLGGKYGNINISVLRKTERFTNTTNAVHEVGHNVAGAHVHGNNYEYDQDGLQNNVNPYVTPRNTKEIINDDLNRSTIKP